jgi:hypothetical protein
MSFDLESSVEILARTPRILDAWLRGLSDPWVRSDEGPDTWSPFDVVGHLVHGERSDWMPRARIILEQGPSQPFEPFDRFAQLEANRELSLAQLLDRFTALRRQNLETLRDWELDEKDLARRGTHPELGEVTLAQLIATWTVHDLGHVAQIARTMAGRLASEVGVWKEYLPVLSSRS